MYSLEELSDIIAEQCSDSEGDIHYEEECEDGTTIEVCGRYSLVRYMEDDYFHGTGAWICTDAEVDITELLCYDSEGNELELPYCEWELEERLRKELID